MGSETIYTDILHRIRKNRARILIKFGDNQNISKMFYDILDGIGKDADILHSENQFLDEICERLDYFETYIGRIEG